MTKVTLPDGTQAEIEDREIVEEKTPWNTFKLDDGTVLKIRLNVLSVQRILEKWDVTTGDPSYIVKNDLTIRTRAPAKLKAKTLHKTETQQATEIR
ncbi:MAG: hypothetical protein V3U30_00975 [Thermoplasmata archaeon]|nr:hypothetical protein [Candidatus Thermoplasmatota archaeon]